ncbi:hypothetical protein TNCV_5063181 [Trichonephila clavipes]|nr:hypothetical protein TNCV_5063181 [Trichonephila clavipes]
MSFKEVFREPFTLFTVLHGSTECPKCLEFSLLLSSAAHPPQQQREKEERGLGFFLAALSSNGVLVTQFWGRNAFSQY